MASLFPSIFPYVSPDRPDSFLKNLDELKEKKGVDGFWKEEQYKKWREDIKKTSWRDH